jgi:large repetitive protein
MNVKVLLSLLTVLFLNIYSVKSQSRTVQLSVESSDAKKDDTFCANVKISKIDSLTAIQFSLNYDPRVLKLETKIPGTCLPKLSAGDIQENKEPGKISFLWLNDAVNIDTTCTLFSLCFKFIGVPGDTSKISFTNNPVSIEAIKDSLKQSISLNVITNSTTVTVLPVGREIIAGFCNPSTKGGSDGKINFYGIAGTAPYSYILRDGLGNNVRSGTALDKEEITLSNILEGSYVLTMVDALGQVFPSKPLAIIDGGKVPSFTITGAKPSCFSSNNGRVYIVNKNAISLNPKIIWSTGDFDVDSLVDVGNGIYTATMTDDNRCSVSNTIVLQTDTLKAFLTLLDSATCLGKTDGRFRLSISGGTPSYNYTIGGSLPIPLSGSNTVIRGFGNISISVKDKAINYLGNVDACTIKESIFIPFKNVSAVNTIATNAPCKGDLGKVQIEMLGPGTRFTFPTQFNIDTRTNINPPGIGGVNVYKNDSLKPGNYYVIARTSQPTLLDGCLDTVKFSIREALTPFLVTSDIVQPSCTAFGSINIIPSGGQAPYSYEWQDGDTSKQKTNLNAGTFKVTVTDFYKCDTTFTIELKSSSNVIAKATIIKQVSCNNSKDGSVGVDVSGGTYNWINNLGVTWNTQNIDNLSAGTYKVTVTKDGCISQDSVVLLNPIGLSFDSIQIIQPECPVGGSRGSIGAEVSGGVGKIDYEWYNIQNPGAIIGAFSTLPSIVAGSYRLVVKDGSACSKDTLINLKAPDPIIITLLNSTNITCNGDSNASAFIEAVGGKIPGNNKYTFFWSNGQTSSGLFARDVNVQLSAGRNFVIAGDTKCLSDTFFIDVPDVLPLEVKVKVDNICGKNCSGKIKLSATGGNDELTYNWPSNTGITADSLSNLCEGKFPYKVTDVLGCSFEDTIAVVVSDSISLTFDSIGTIPITCKTPQGRIAVNVLGGSPEYTYQWIGSSSSNKIADKLNVGTYTVTVTDKMGCSNSLTKTFTKPEPIVADIANPLPPKCFGDGSCIVVNSVIGGSGSNYSMQINNGLRIPIDSCLLLIPSTYLVSIFDQDGCKTDYNITIPSVEKLELNLGEDIKINFSDSINEIKPIISGPNPIVKYEWRGIGKLFYPDSTTKSSLTGKPISDQFISLQIIDSNGCKSNDELVISVSKSRNVYIPNVIKLSAASNKNRKFDLVTGSGIELVENLTIYDRWGNVVFQKRNYIPDVDSDDGWDGTFNKSPLTPGVFVLTAKIKFSDGEIKIYKGDITLLN